MKRTLKGDISAHKHSIFLLILTKGISQIHSIQAFSKFSNLAFPTLHWGDGGAGKRRREWRVEMNFFIEYVSNCF